MEGKIVHIWNNFQIFLSRALLLSVIKYSEHGIPRVKQPHNHKKRYN
jgi:hypothetical protein